ncbi:hypothetical protein [Oceanobacillus sp. CF4.6]|uniref:hypothetical protein n=1 Tax=Oceanobacillus sp. CF4.6 TaxID=3373080 RepID=UPI003EE5A818
MDKRVNVRKKYDGELMKIRNKLNQLEKGRIYDLTNAQMDSYLSTNIEQLREIIEDLIYKIEYDEESINEKSRKSFDRFHAE